MKLIDLTGQRFDRLRVIKRGANIGGRPAWLCECDCGNIKTVSANHLLQGKTGSCGCLHNELLSSRSTIHGDAPREHKTRLYKVYNNMISRCHRPGFPAYHNYGGRGITVYDEWRNSYAAFRAWALSSGYDENAPKGVCTIDRINNDEGYYPENCRWVSMKVQSSNTRRCSNAASR